MVDEIAPPTGDASEGTATGEPPVAVSLSDAEEKGREFGEALAPLGPTSAPKKRGRPPLTAAEKAQRAAQRAAAPKQKAKREKALKAVAATLKTDLAQPEPTGDAPLPSSAVAVDAPVVIAPDPMLSKMIGKGVDFVARIAPREFGGGRALAESDKQDLGDAWAVALVPYLDGPTSALAVAAISTVQIFAIRAMENKEQDERGEVISTGVSEKATPTQRAVSAAPVAPAAPDATAEKPEPKGRTAATPMGKAEKRIKLPTHTGED